VADHPGIHQREEPLQRLRQRHLAAPVQEIQVEPVGAEAAQARLTSGHRAQSSGMLRQHLANEEHLIATSRDRLTHQDFGFALGIHLGRIDQGQAQVQPDAECLDLVAPASG
jgi:hypothetical protein